jgi:DNA repair protein RadA/Sms
LKSKSVYVCQTCGSQSAKWIGHCPACNEWNTYVEEIIRPAGSKKHLKERKPAKPQKLDDINIQKLSRIKTGNSEFDRVIGGGLVTGSMILIGGEPGIGKSTLVLQLSIQQNNVKTLYISGEESLQQLKMRAERLGSGHKSLFFLSETSLEGILAVIDEFEPKLLIIDSIQTLTTETADSSAGSVTQTRECTNQLIQYAKTNNCTVLLIGHINKDGQLAGPKVLEHMVDTVLQFEGDQNHMYRILRVSKNRFGPTDEMGIYEMRSDGLHIVPNPSEFLLANREMKLSGNTVAAIIEGQRPLMLQSQALVSTAAYGTPQRTATGFDNRRLSMLLAVLEKRAGFRLAVKDVFLNMVGGLRVADTAADMAIVSAILSSENNQAVEQNICFTGELGLSGEFRPVTRIELRVAEASKLGFKQMMIPYANLKNADISRFDIQVEPLRHIGELYKKLF